MNEFKLIPMTEFVLEQRMSTEEVNKSSFTDIRNHICEYYDKVFSYANFLNQSLTLGMLVPCDEEGNVLKEPIYNVVNYGVSPYGFTRYEKDLKLYKEARERVLFKNIKIGSYSGEVFYFKNLGKSYLINNGIIYDDNPNSAPQPTADTIEDLLQWNENLELTETAIKQIKL